MPYTSPLHSCMATDTQGDGALEASDLEEQRLITCLLSFPVEESGKMFVAHLPTKPCGGRGPAPCAPPPVTRSHPWSLYCWAASTVPGTQESISKSLMRE